MKLTKTKEYIIYAGSVIFILWWVGLGIVWPLIDGFFAKTEKIECDDLDFSGFHYAMRLEKFQEKYPELSFEKELYGGIKVYNLPNETIKSFYGLKLKELRVQFLDNRLHYVYFIIDDPKFENVDFLLNQLKDYESSFLKYDIEKPAASIHIDINNCIEMRIVFDTPEIENSFESMSVMVGMKDELL